MTLERTPDASLSGYRPFTGWLLRVTLSDKFTQLWMVG
jgi:hypothetical protein